MDYSDTEPQPSGLTEQGAKLFSTAFSSAASKDDDWWIRAECLAAELIGSIQPVSSSERGRQDIVRFIHDLIGNCLGDVQVQTFGSVPLKTYLPDGDIDLTALSDHTHLKETWAQDLVKALNVQSTVENDNAQFRVKDVQYIQADVKIIKCLVESTVVDISFNQTGGLCTFCFLEEVDRHIGQDHLFKKSIILVKAWCYYESRILGAHHGLMSTYALETLVLYIFHVFHSSLRGPLKVLYIFLVYFSNFDWDKYCVSLWGPLPLKRISVDSAEPPRKDGGSLLLAKEFLDTCIKNYSGDSAGRDFKTKFLNVLDPIRYTNNLGRSVHLGSFKRIRLAFALGARTLGEILEGSQDQINERFKSFFSCTFENLERYRSSGRPDTGYPVTRGVKHSSSGVGKERFFSGHKQANGLDSRHSATFFGENIRPSFQHNQDSSRWVSSRTDSVSQDSFTQSRDVSGPRPSLSNQRQPRSLGGSKISSHRNSNRKLSSGDENDASTSGRKSATSEESKATTSKCVPHWYSSPVDISYQGRCQDSDNQNMVQPLPYTMSPPMLKLPADIYRNQMHLPVLSAIRIPAPSSSGPPSASSPFSGEPYASRPNLYVSMPILPPAVPATSSCMVSIAPLRNGAIGRTAGLSPHAGVQWENWRSPFEDQMQPLHRASDTTGASLCGSFLMENTSLSEGCWSPFSVAPPTQPQFDVRKLKPIQGGSGRSSEIAEFSNAYAPIGDNLSRLSISDGRLGESSLEEETDHWALRTRKRANRSKSLEIKVSDGRHANGTRGAGQLSRSQSFSGKSGRCIPRSADGQAAELSFHRIRHPSFEETSVGDMQGSSLPPFPSPPHCHQEILCTIPRYHKGSPIQSCTLEPASPVPYQSPKVRTPQASAGINWTSTATLDRQVLLPVSVGISGASSGSFHSPTFDMHTGPDGVFRGDSVGSLHSDGLKDYGTVIHGSQSRKDARLRIMPQVGMGFAERPQRAVAVISPRNRVEMSNVERMSDEAGSGDDQDILWGSSYDDKVKLLASFQNSCSDFLSPNSATRFPKSPQLFDCSDRQKGDLNLSLPLGGASPSYPLRGQVAEGTQQPGGSGFHVNEDSLPKSWASTGTLPSSRMHTFSNRERPGPDGGGWGGNQHGRYGQQDPNNLERINQPHAPRYRSGGQGQGQHSMHEPRAQMMMSAQKNPARDLGGSSTPHQQQHQSIEKNGLPPVSSSPSSQPSSTRHRIPSSNGNSAGAPVVSQFSGNEASAVLSLELKFGSVGSMRSG